MRPPHASARRAFVFGNAAIDEVFLVRALPAPGESVLSRAGRVSLGGKGANQAIAVARTGVPTCFVGVVGSDWQGEAVRAVLAAEPVDARLILRDGLSTDRSVILAQQDGDNVVVTTNECAQSLSFAECQEVLDQARPGDAVLLQGNLALDVTAALARASARLGLALVLNPSPFDPALGDLLPLTHTLFVNEPEAMGLTGSTGRDAVTALLRAGARQVVLTLGANGALLGTAETVVHVPACQTGVVDVTGAGDCFEGVAVGSALLRGTDLDETAIRHASIAAAHTIAAVGASQAFPTAEDLAAIIAEG